MNPNHRNPVQRLSCGRLFHSIFILLVIILLSGCITLPPKVETVKTDYDPKTEARIRVFPLDRTFLFPGRSCYSANDENMIHIRHNYVVTRNRDVGMPKRANMMPGYYEYVIPANQPLTVVSMRRGRHALNAPPSNQVASTGNRTYCGPVPITFIPQPGEDYEAFCRTSSGFASARRYCFIQLQRLVQISETHLKIEDVDFEEAELCP